MVDPKLRLLFDNYVPLPATLSILSKVTLVAVVGPTAVGKTTLIDYVTRHDDSSFRMITDVSRDPRQDEREGIDYYFRSKQDLLDDLKKGLLVQTVLAENGDIYGSRATSFSSKGRSIMAVQSVVLPIFRSLPFARLRTICVVPPDYEIWMKRIRVHQFTSDELRVRLLEARRSLLFADQDKDSQLLMNDDLNTTKRLFMNLLREEPQTDELIENQRQAKKTLKPILAKLDRELGS